VRKQLGEKEILVKDCYRLLAEILDHQPTVDEVGALYKMCTLMQTCDTASYSYYGITRDQETGVHYFNDNAMFTHSLSEPTGFLGRTVRMKNPTGKTN
jgi:hypothetical protein